MVIPGTKFQIKSIGMANYLVRCGHDIVGVGDDKLNSYYKVFFFWDSEKLREDMSKYCKK